MVQTFKAEFDIPVLLKHKGSTGGLQRTTNANPVKYTPNKNIKPPTERESTHNIFPKPRWSTERMASGGRPFGRLDTV